MTDRLKAIKKLDALRRNHKRNKQWRNTGYFDVPGSVMRELVEEGCCETRKVTLSSPQEYRP